MKQPNVSEIVVKRSVPDFPEMAGEAQDMVLDKELEDELDKKFPELPKLETPVVTEKPPDTSSLSVADLRYLLEQKLLAEANEAVQQKEKVKAPTKAPKGMLWMFNRGATKYEWQYNGIMNELEGHEMGLFDQHVARLGRKHSIISLDAFTNKAVFRISLEGEEKFGIPLKVVNRSELVDRSVNDNPLGRGPGRTHPVILTVDGVAEMMTRRSGQFVELE